MWSIDLLGHSQSLHFIQSKDSIWYNATAVIALRRVVFLVVQLKFIGKALAADSILRCQLNNYNVFSNL